MRKRIDNDHWRSARNMERTLSGLAKILGGGITLTRMGLMYYESERASRAIDEGTVSGKLENARLGTLDDLAKLGMLEPPGFHLGYFDGRPVYLKNDWHLAIMGMAGLGKMSSISAPNIIRLLRGGDEGRGQESVIALDWKNGELVRMTADGIEAATGIKPIIFAPFERDNQISINVFQDLIDVAAAGEPIVDDAKARLYPFFAKSIANAAANAWIDKAAFNLAHHVAVTRAYLDPEILNLGGM